MPLKRGQCLIQFTALLFLAIPSDSGKIVWIDNIYLRERSVSPAPNLTDITWPISVVRQKVEDDITSGPSVWITNITIQGNQQRTLNAL
jgi:hypothetical protein